MTRSCTTSSRTPARQKKLSSYSALLSRTLSISSISAGVTAPRRVRPVSVTKTVLERHLHRDSSKLDLQSRTGVYPRRACCLGGIGARRLRQFAEASSCKCQNDNLAAFAAIRLPRQRDRAVAAEY